jgi:hypothetical protein
MIPTPDRQRWSRAGGAAALVVCLLGGPAGALQEPPERPAPPGADAGRAQEPAGVERTATGDRILPGRGVRVREAGMQPGWTLFSPLKSNAVYLVNERGELMHTWDAGCKPGNSVYLLEDGSLLRATRDDDTAGFSGGGIGGRAQRLDLAGRVLWDVDLSTRDFCHHHDLEPLPNGNVLGIFWERKSREELLAAGADPEMVGDAEEFWPDAIYELRPEGADGYEIVWSWHVWDHLLQDMDRDRPHYGLAFDDPHRVHLNGSSREPRMTAAERERLVALGYLQPADGDGDADAADEEPEPVFERSDWLHSNGIDYLPELDLIVLSVRSLNEIWFIDHSTTRAEAQGTSGGRFGRGGDLLFRWGNPAAHGMGNIEDQRLFAQHDARFVSGDETHVRVTVFNNGRGRPLTAEPYSTVEELVIPLTDGAFPTLDPDGLAQVEHLTPYGEREDQRRYASFISGASKQPNGNLLVCYGDAGLVREIGPDGELLWEYAQPYEAQETGGERGGRGGGPGGRRPPLGGPPPGRRPGGGPPQGGPQEGGPKDRATPQGGPPSSASPQDGAGAGGPQERTPGGAPAGSPSGNRGGGFPSGVSMFRATRIPDNHPGLARVKAYLAKREGGEGRPAEER